MKILVFALSVLFPMALQATDGPTWRVFKGSLQKFEYADAQAHTQALQYLTFAWNNRTDGNVLDRLNVIHESPLAVMEGVKLSQGVLHKGGASVTYGLIVNPTLWWAVIANQFKKEDYWVSAAFPIASFGQINTIDRVIHIPNKFAVSSWVKDIKVGPVQ